MRHLIIKTLLIATLPILLPNCAGTYRSSIHSKKSWKAFRENKANQLPPASIPVAKTTLAFEHSMGFPPMFGGFNGSLLAANPDLVKVDYNVNNGSSKTYLTGLKPGTTQIYLINGFSHLNYTSKPFSEIKKELPKNTPTYTLTIKEPSQPPSQ